MRLAVAAHSPYRQGPQEPRAFLSRPRLSDALGEAYTGLLCLAVGGFFASPLLVIFTHEILGVGSYLATGCALLGSLVFLFVAALFVPPAIEHLARAAAIVTRRSARFGVLIDPCSLLLRWSDGTEAHFRRGDVHAARRVGGSLVVVIDRPSHDPRPVVFDLPPLSVNERAALDACVSTWVDEQS